MSTRPDRPLTFTRLPDVTIRNTSKVNADLGSRNNIENQNHCKDPAPGSREGHLSVTDFWKKLGRAAWDASTSGLWGVCKGTHTPVTGLHHEPGLREREGDAVFWGSANDWQKLSGTPRQLRADTQQAHARDCMIRRAGSQGRGIFRELCHPSEISYRLGLNMAHT